MHDVSGEGRSARRPYAVQTMFFAPERNESAGARAGIVFTLLFCGYMLSYFHRFSPGAAAGDIKVFFRLDSAGFGLVGAVT